MAELESNIDPLRLYTRANLSPASVGAFGAPYLGALTEGVLRLARW